MRQNIFKTFLNKFSIKKHIDAANAYDILAESYDLQKDNLLLQLDNDIFKSITENIDFAGKTIVDAGCGTGRYWDYLKSKKPANIIGYDVSEKMLNVLRSKHFGAEVYMALNNKFNKTGNSSCDVVISNLTIGYISDFKSVIKEWVRVLKSDGEIIITDYHPAILLKGADRDFIHAEKRLSIKNFIHTLKFIKKIARENGLRQLNFEEKLIDNSLKEFYERKNALHIYERFRNTPVIYGLHLRRQNAVS